MVIKKFLFLVLFIGYCFANEFAYINIDSNVKDTPIFLDNEQIGTTPIHNYKINAYQNYKLKAIADKKYYKNDIIKNISLTKDQLVSYNIKFQKANGQVLFLGEPVDLYINGRFNRRLNRSNRLVTLKASPKLNIKLINKNEDVLTLQKDIVANKKQTIKYKLIKTNKDIKLYTTFIGNDMWQDTVENKTKTLNWEKAKLYCKFLELGGFHDWKMPTIQQLDNLYTHKEKIYNGFSKGFYWSRTMKKSKNKLWEYSFIKYFETGETKSSVKEITKGYIRCVRDIKPVQQDM
jgi:hypothetical protein